MRPGTSSSIDARSFVVLSARAEITGSRAPNSSSVGAAINPARDRRSCSGSMKPRQTRRLMARLGAVACDVATLPPNELPMIKAGGIVEAP
jgi:hypothetical protein